MALIGYIPILDPIFGARGVSYSDWPNKCSCPSFGLRTELGQLKLYGPRVGDVWFPRGKLGGYYYKKGELKKIDLYYGDFGKSLHL